MTQRKMREAVRYDIAVEYADGRRQDIQGTVLGHADKRLRAANVECEGLVAAGDKQAVRLYAIRCELVSEWRRDG